MHKDQVKKFYSVLWDADDKDQTPSVLHEDFTFRGSLGQEKRGHAGFAGGSVSVSGGPSGWATSNRVTYAFEKGLPEGSLGPGWIWAIKTFDRWGRARPTKR